MITRHPPPTPAGVKLVSLGLCMLIAFNGLVSTPGLEKQALDWIRTLVHEEKYFQSGKCQYFKFFVEILKIFKENLFKAKHTYSNFDSN